MCESEFNNLPLEEIKIKKSRPITLTFELPNLELLYGNLPASR